MPEKPSKDTKTALNPRITPQLFVKIGTKLEAYPRLTNPQSATYQRHRLVGSFSNLGPQVWVLFGFPFFQFAWDFWSEQEWLMCHLLPASLTKEVASLLQASNALYPAIKDHTTSTQPETNSHCLVDGLTWRPTGSLSIDREQKKCASEVRLPFRWRKGLVYVYSDNCLSRMAQTWAEGWLPLILTTLLP